MRASCRCLAAVKESLVSLVFCRKTDHGTATTSGHHVRTFGLEPKT